MIQDTLSKVVYTADGEQRQWDVPFQFNDSKDLHIYLTDDGVRVEEVFQNFEVVENGEKKEVDNPDIDFNKEGNYVIYPTPESGLAPLEAGKQILILRETPNTQEEDSSEIYFKSKDIERGLDKLTMQVQELARDSYRAVKVSHFDTTTPEDFTEMLFEAGAKAEEAAARAATSESNAALSEQNAASSASSSASASASAIAASQLATSKAEESLRNAERAEIAAADSNMHATNSAESASMAATLLQEVSNSIYNKAQVDAKISGLQAEIDTVESYIPSDTSDSNMLINKKELINKETDIREDLNLGLNGLQNQIAAQSSAIAGKQEKGDYATVSQVNAKQDKLVAGPNITIDGNVISATGGGEGGSSEAVWGGITGDINAQTDLTNLINAKTAAIDEKQDKLTAGEGIVIEGNVISATGGGGGGSAELPDNVYTQDNLIAGENITFSEVLPEGGIDEHTLACWHFDEDLVDEKNNLTLVGRGFEITAEASKFGNCSAKMNSSGDYATVVSAVFADLFTKDFTIDFWLRREEFYVGNTLFGFSDKENAYDVRSFPFNFALGSAGSSTSSDIFRINDTKIGSVGFSDVKVFGHIAIVFSRENRTCSLYLNGSKLGEYIFSTLPTDTRNLSFYFPGSGTTMRIDEFRISDCIRWNEDFTPPTEPYTLATGPSKKAINAVIPEVELPNTVYTQDNLVAGENIQIKEVVNPNVIDDNTLLCWHFDGDTKDVVNGEDFTLYPGYGSINNTYYKFGSGSAPDYVQNGLYITLKEPLTDKDSFTLDYWIYGHGADTDTLSFTTRLAGGIGTTNGTSIYLRAFGNDQNLLDVSDANGNYVGSLAKSNSISSKEWSHWAYTYNKDTRELSVYANGVKQGAYAFPSGNPFNIEIIYPVDTNYNQFAIDEFRVTKSLAWDKDFTPPTEAYTKGEGGVKKAISAIIPPVKLPSDVYRQTNLLGGKDIEIVPEPVDGGVDEYTLACWNFDKDTKDEVNGLVFETYRDYAKVSTDYQCLGDGVGNLYHSSGKWTFDVGATADWTIEGFFMLPDTNGCYLGRGDYYSNAERLSQCYLRFDTTKLRIFDYQTELAVYEKDFGTYNWVHLALQSKSGKIQAFCDGVKVMEVDAPSGGFSGGLFAVTSKYLGRFYADAVRISNIARYTEDFTPPTQPYRKAEPTGNYVINYVKPVGEVEALKTDFSNYGGFPHTIDPQKIDGVLYLQTNKIYRLGLEGHTILSLPTMPDETTSSNQILIKAYVNSGASLDWGTYNFYNKSVPTLEEETYYDLVFDYDQGQLAWVAAAIHSGRTDI